MRIERPTDEERGAFKLREAEALAHLHPGVDKLLAAERRATVQRALVAFDAAWQAFDGAYGNPRPKWALAKIRAAIASLLNEEAVRD